MKPKRLLSILLAAVLLSGCLCGVSLAAEVETETVALRPGHTVAVETADEFIALTHCQKIGECVAEVSRLSGAVIPERSRA